MFHAARRPILAGSPRRGMQSAEWNIPIEIQSAECSGARDLVVLKILGMYDSVRPSSGQYCSSALSHRECSIPQERFSHRNSTSLLRRKRQKTIPLVIFSSSFQYENTVKISSNPSAEILKVFYLSIEP